MEEKNTFGLTAFTSYGFFWLTLVGLIVMPKLGWITSSSTTAMSLYLILWGVFTLLLFIGTLRISKALQFIFATLTILFFLLAIGDLSNNAAIKYFAGYEGIVCGLSAIYAGIAQVLNEIYGKELLPLGIVKRK